MVDKHSSSNSFGGERSFSKGSERGGTGEWHGYGSMGKKMFVVLSASCLVHFANSNRARSTKNKALCFPFVIDPLCENIMSQTKFRPELVDASVYLAAERRSSAMYRSGPSRVSGSTP